MNRISWTAFPALVLPVIRFVPGRRRDGANVGERARKVRDAAGGVPQGAHRLCQEDEEGL